MRSQVFDSAKDVTSPHVCAEIKDRLLHDLKHAYGVTDVNVVTQRVNRYLGAALRWSNLCCSACVCVCM